jgi:hypothetical protein
MWCFAIEWAAKVRSLTAHNSIVLRSQTPEERVSGQTPDISEYAHYAWYEWIWYCNEASFPDQDLCLGKWIGVASKVGQAMMYWVLTPKGTIIARSSVARLSDLERRDPMVIKDQENFMKSLSDLKNYEPVIQDSIFIPSEVTNDDDLIEDDYQTPEADEYTPDSYDEYLLAQVVLPKGDAMLRGEVVLRHKDANGRPIGKRNIKTILDTREYEVLFPDGSSQTYLANTIAENLYSQADEEGRSFLLLNEIMDHERSEMAISKSELTPQY